MRKSTVLNILFLVIIVIILFFLFKSEESNSRLIHQIELKDSLSKNTIKKDSVFAKKTEEYAKVITKYVSDCNFTIGDKTITTAEVVKMTNKAMREVDLLSDSLSYMNKMNNEYKRVLEVYKKSYKESSSQNELSSDSAFIYKGLLTRMSKMYDLKYSFKKDGNMVTFQIDENKKIDSGLRLLPFYRHTLYFDVAKNDWYIITDTERNIKRAEKLKKKN